MFTALFLTLAQIVTAIVGVIAARDVITDRLHSGRRKLNRLGRYLITCAFLMVLFPLIAGVIQSKIDEAKETSRKIETEKHDSILREEYRKSVQQIRRDFGDSNNRTLTVIGQTLAKYKLGLDTAEQKINTLVKDSMNVKTEQPVLAVVSPDGIPIKFLKFENGLNYYSINFVSQDGASCCFDLNISAVVRDSGDAFATYKTKIPVRLTKTDVLAKNAFQPWNFTIDNSDPYDVMYLWIRGTYYDRTKTHKYTLEEIDFNRKSSNTCGKLGQDSKRDLMVLVSRNEK
jgi:hypothetical protein